MAPVHSVWPYPSNTKQPSAQRMNVNTLPASGAEPTTIRRRLPPKAELYRNIIKTMDLSRDLMNTIDHLPWCTFLKTNLSQHPLRRIIPRASSFSLALSAILNIVRLIAEDAISFCILS